MMFTAMLILVVLIPTVLWLGISIWRRRGAQEHGRPHATDGGPPTVYRRRTPREDEVIGRGAGEQGPTPA